MAGVTQPFGLQQGPPPFPDPWEFDFRASDDTSVGVRGLVPALPQLPAGRTADEYSIRADGQLNELAQFEPVETYAIPIDITPHSSARPNWGTPVELDGRTNVTGGGNSIVIPEGTWRLTCTLVAETMTNFSPMIWRNAVDNSDLPIQAKGSIGQITAGNDGVGSSAVAIVKGPISVYVACNLVISEWYRPSSNILVEKLRENVTPVIQPGAQQGTIGTPAANEWVSSQEIAALQPPAWYRETWGQVAIPLNSTAAIAFGLGYGRYQVWLISDTAPGAGSLYHEVHVEFLAGASFYLGMPATSMHQAPTLTNNTQTIITDNAGGWANSIYTVNNVNAEVRHAFAAATGRSWTLYWRKQVAE